jgi:hypothetical protein
MAQIINWLLKYFGIRKPASPYVSGNLKIFHTEYPKDSSIDFFEWAKEFKIGSDKDEAQEVKPFGEYYNLRLFK